MAAGPEAVRVTVRGVVLYAALEPADAFERLGGATHRLTVAVPAARLGLQSGAEVEIDDHGTATVTTTPVDPWTPEPPRRRRGEPEPPEITPHPNANKFSQMLLTLAD